MSEDGQPRRARRRRRATAQQGPPPVPVATPTTADGAGAPPAGEDARRRARGADEQVPGADETRRQRPRRKPARASGRDSTDRGLRDLVGAGPSQLGVSGALRGRDADRPTAEELAEAERDLVIVRRHWKPDPS